MVLRLAAVWLALLPGCQVLLGIEDYAPTLGGPCSTQEPCTDGEVCDLTAPGGAVCISADGDVDGDGIPNAQDYCQHVTGGAYDEDNDGYGDECDRCPIAPPPATPDADGDDVDAPCDPDPGEPGDKVIFFDGFSAGLDTRWRESTPGLFSVSGGELIANIGLAGTEQRLITSIVGATTVGIQASYKVERVENGANTHILGVGGRDPAPAAGEANIKCGVQRADAVLMDQVFVETKQGYMATTATNPSGVFLTSQTYRAGAYRAGSSASCGVTAGRDAVGAAQTTIVAGQIAEVWVTATAASARFQWFLVVGK